MDMSVDEWQKVCLLGRVCPRNWGKYNKHSLLNVLFSFIIIKCYENKMNSKWLGL